MAALWNKSYWFYLIAVFTVTIWGITFVSTKVLINNGLSPVEIMFYRFALAYVGLCFLSHDRLLAKNLKDELLFIAAGACGGSLYFVAENTALGITLASNVSLIICTSPILTAFLAFFLKKEPLRARLISGSLIAFVGVALVVFNGRFVLNINPAGDLLTFFAALMWALYCIILKSLDARYTTLFITRKVFFYGVATLLPILPFSPIHFDTELLFRPLILFNLLFLSLVASMLCFILWNAVVKNLGAVKATNFIYIMPLITVLTSALIIDEPITVVSIIGALLIIGGVYIAERGFKNCLRR